MNIKEILKETIKESLQQLEINTDKEILIEVPKNKEFGDYSSNIALLLSKELKQNPFDIANNIKEHIINENITKVEVVRPGFINFYVNKKYLFDNINKILEEKENYGKSNYGNNKKINLEYVSANPTGTLHIGHGRGAAYGDNLSRILKFIGYDVTREYYVNDAGNQIVNLGLSVKERYKEQCGLDFEIPENGYFGKEIIELAKNIYKNYKDTKLNEDLEFFKKESVQILLDQIKKDLDKFRINFDVFTSEQSIYDNQIVDKILEKLKQSNKCFIEENALWLKTTDYTDDKDRVLIKSDGTYTYFLPDIAYHYHKFSRGYDQLIDVFGADHYGYINRLKSAMEIIGEDRNKLDIKILQMVRLIKDGEEFKMSKRTGKSVTLMDLVEEIGINACRYFFASKSLDSQMDLDLDLAVKNSNENPVYYIEYANARICSILRNNKPDQNIKNYDTITNEIAYNILKKLYEFEEIVISAGEKQLPHLIANYIYELTTLFHSYYANEKIVSDDEIYTKQRINLIAAIKIVINNSLNLIGVIPREEM